MKKEGNLLLQFIIGLALLVAGLYWFLTSVTVTTGFGRFSIGRMDIGAGLVVVPFLVGIIMLFFNFDSILAKIVTGLGLLVIIASVIGNTDFKIRQMSLYAYLVMLVMIFGGTALVLKVLLKPLPGEKEKK